METGQLSKEELNKKIKHEVRIATYIVGGIVTVVGAFGLYSTLVPTDTEFLKKEVVTLEGKVVDERYVPPALGNHTSTPSEYFFSIDTGIGRRLGIQVIDAQEPPLQIEYVDARLEKGTWVKVKARQVGEAAYKAFANDVCLPEFQKCE